MSENLGATAVAPVAPVVTSLVHVTLPKWPINWFKLDQQSIQQAIELVCCKNWQNIVLEKLLVCGLRALEGSEW